MAARPSERAGLLPNIDEWASAELGAVQVASDTEGYGAARAKQQPRMRRPRPRTTVRQDVWTLLHYRASIRNRTGLLRWSYVIEVGILVLISVNVALAMWFSSVVAGGSPSDPLLNPKSSWYDLFLYVSTVIFTVEYLLRLWACVEDKRYPHPIFGRLKWMTRPMSVIDLAVLIPFYLEISLQSEPYSRGIITLRGLRLLRIMSFLRLERSYQAMKNLREIFALKHQELAVVTYLTAMLVLTSSTTIFFLENPVQPKVFSSIGVSAWWAVETITSLGYGDIVPITPVGRIFSSMLALWGIILFTIPGAVLSSGFVEVMLKREQDEKKALEEALRYSFSRDGRSFSASTIFYNAQGVRYESPKSEPVSPLSRTHMSTRRMSRPSLLQHQQSFSAQPPAHLQEKIDQLTDMQLLLQERLDRQDAKLELILKLLQTPVAPPVVVQAPPFSAIVPPDDETIFE